MVSSLILLRSLRVYILKQFFFSISVNSGFRNIYLAAIFSHYSPRFQRIIVKYPYSSRPKQTHTHIHTHSPPPPPGFLVPEPCHFTYMPSLLFRSCPFRCSKEYDNNKLEDLLLGRHFKIFLQDAYYLGYFRPTAWDDPDALGNQLVQVWIL